MESKKNRPQITYSWNEYKSLAIGKETTPSHIKFQSEILEEIFKEVPITTNQPEYVDFILEEGNERWDPNYRPQSNKRQRESISLVNQPW